MTPKQKANEGLKLLKEAVLDILPPDGSTIIRPAYITKRLGIEPHVTATGAKYSAIVINILEMLEKEPEPKVKGIKPDRPRSHKHWIRI